MGAMLKSPNRLWATVILCISVLAAVGVYFGTSRASETFEARASVAIATPLSVDDLADARLRLVSTVPDGQLQALAEESGAAGLRIEVPEIGSQIVVVGVASNPGDAVAAADAGAALVTDTANTESPALEGELVPLSAAESALDTERTSLGEEVLIAIERESVAVVAAQQAVGEEREELDAAIDEAIEDRIALVRRRDEVVDSQNVFVRDRHALAIEVATRPNTAFVVPARTPTSSEGIQPLTAASFALFAVLAIGLVGRWSLGTVGPTP